MCLYQTHTIYDWLQKKRFYLILIGNFNNRFLLWMFSPRVVKYKINRLPERGLIVSPNDETSTYNEMQLNSNDATIHVKGIQKLMTEFYKYLYGLLASIMKEIFLTKEPLNVAFKVVE